MADDQASQNEVEGDEAPEISDAVEATTTAVIKDAANPLADDYPDESSEDYIVKLVVDDAAGKVTPNLVNAAITDQFGNVLTTRSSIIDSINGYSSTLYDELNSNNTAVTGGKGWWGKFIT
jgi:hypothetical protein